MGIKDFTKVFDNHGEVKYKELKGKNIVIDASVEIYRSALGMSKSNVLVDSYGNPTAHINIILLGVILKLKAAGANQYWIFDHNQQIDKEHHNPLKQLELKKRSAKKKAANEKIMELKEKLSEMNVAESDKELFSDSDEDEEKATIKKHIDKQEKAAFTMEAFYIEDVIFMLDMLDIPWVECPPGYDAEQFAAIATYDTSVFNTNIDYILSTDADSLLFGGKVLIKRDVRKKKFFKYDLNRLLTDYKITQNDLIKIGVILGTDFAPKTPRVGPKTVLKKFNNIELTAEQQNALSQFNKKLNENDKKNIKIINGNGIPFTDKNKYKLLLDWLQSVKNYNRERIVKQFTKQNLFV